MQITVEIEDNVAAELEEIAKWQGQPLEALVRDSLCGTIRRTRAAKSFKIKPVGDPTAPKKDLPWREMASAIYGDDYNDHDVWATAGSGRGSQAQGAGAAAAETAETEK